jgi:hypothetical protein
VKPAAVAAAVVQVAAAVAVAAAVPVAEVEEVDQYHPNLPIYRMQRKVVPLSVKNVPEQPNKDRISDPPEVFDFLIDI